MGSDSIDLNEAHHAGLIVDAAKPKVLNMGSDTIYIGSIYRV